MTRNARPWLVLLVGALLSGCGGGGDQPAPPGDGGALDGDDFVPCQDDPRVDKYSAGMEKTSQKNLFKVALMASDPAPPIKGTNSWAVRVNDASSGAPQTGATFKITPFMPDHQHGTSIKAAATPLGSDGQYTVAPLYLFMAGVWQVTLEVTSPAGAKDAVVFTFCVER